MVSPLLLRNPYLTILVFFYLTVCFYPDVSPTLSTYIPKSYQQEAPIFQPFITSIPKIIYIAILNRHDQNASWPAPKLWVGPW